MSMRVHISLIHTYAWAPLLPLSRDSPTPSGNHWGK